MAARQNIINVGAGAQHVTVQVGGEQSGHSVPPEVEPKPPPREEMNFQGRGDEITALRAVLLAGPPAAAIVLGEAGIGKSTLTLHVLHDPAVSARYVGRRSFVRLDAAPNAAAAVDLIAAALGLCKLSDPLADVCRHLGRAPGVLVLDNFETPWDGDRLGAEALLRDLGSVPSLSLVVSMRSGDGPSGLPCPTTRHLTPLSPDAARALFLSLAPEHREHPRLDDLLEPMDGVPLAVFLLASACVRMDLDTVAREWQEHRTAMLRRLGPHTDRLSSWPVSLELSWNCPRMTLEARRLAAVLALLPDGLDSQDIPTVMPADGPAAVRVLVHVGLAFFESGRLRMRAPVREHVQREHPPTDEDRGRVLDHFGELARRLGPRVGASDGGIAVARLAPEMGNLDAVVRGGLAGDEPTRWIDVACALTNLARFTGREEPSPLREALKYAGLLADARMQAACLWSLGIIALDRSRHGEAADLLDQALPLYQRVGDVLGEARCIERHGDIALERSRHDDAAGLYHQALRLFQRVGDVLGEAHCIVSLGDIALDRSKHDDAADLYRRALPLFQRVDDVLGEANCILGQGIIALARSKHGEAADLYRQALPLYQRVGDVLGEANCLQCQGYIAFERSKHDEAANLYRQVLPLYQRVGNVLGEANCIMGLGDIALERVRHDEAADLYRQALPLFQRVGDVLGDASCIMGLGNIALARSRHDEASDLFSQALPVFQRVGDVLGEANCIQGMGDIALAQLKHESARAAFLRALEFFSRIPEPNSMGDMHRRLAQIAATPEEGGSHRAEARRLWMSIDRPDLVATLESTTTSVMTDTNATPPSSIIPHWLTSLFAALGAMLWVMLVIALPQGAATVVLLVGAAVFMVVLVHNPEFWLRRAAGTLIGLGATSMLAPHLKGYLVIEPYGAIAISLSPGGPWLLILGVGLAVFDVWNRRRHAPTSSPSNGMIRSEGPRSAAAAGHIIEVGSAKGVHIRSSSPVHATERPILATGEESRAASGDIIRVAGDAAEVTIDLNVPGRP